MSIIRRTVLVPTERSERCQWGATVVTVNNVDSLNGSRAEPDDPSETTLYATERAAGIRDHFDETRVIVIDDHPYTAAGICAHLAQHEGIAVLGSYPMLESVPIPLRKGGIDVAVLDLSLRDGSTGVENVIAVSSWGVAAVVHTGYSTEIVRDACVKQGARGFVGKDASVDELPRVIRAVAAGRYGEAGVEYLELRAPLTDAGKRVLAHLTQVSGSDELARRLSHSSSYVDNIISTLMVKTDCHTRAQLAAWAVRHGCHLLLTPHAAA